MRAFATEDGCDAVKFLQPDELRREEGSPDSPNSPQPPAAAGRVMVLDTVIRECKLDDLTVMQITVPSSDASEITPQLQALYNAYNAVFDRKSSTASEGTISLLNVSEATDRKAESWVIRQHS